MLFPLLITFIIISIYSIVSLYIFKTGHNIFILFYERMISAFDPSKSSTLMNRYDDWRNLIMIILNYPIFGAGFGGYYIAVKNIALNNVHHEYFYIADSSNYLLRLMAHFGPFQIIFILVIIIMHYKTIINKRLKYIFRTNMYYHHFMCELLIYISVPLFFTLIAFPSVVHYPLLAIYGLIYGVTLKNV